MGMFENFLQDLTRLRPDISSTRIQKAYNLAANAHKDQKRVSGEPYITHPLAVAHILLKIDTDEATLVAALLHDTVEDTSITLDVIEKEFDKEIAVLVEGLTKITKVESIGLDKQIGNIRKMFLAMSKDIRVIYIKLADRLHNMQTIATFRVEKRNRIAEETLSIYAPIATRLGIYYFKNELEELCFKILYPEEYRNIEKQLRSYKQTEEKIAEIAVRKLKEHFAEVEVPCLHILWREKQKYSIFRKMQKHQERDINNIYDIFAIRIITNSVENCYRILGIIHQYWKPLQNRFKDYIAVPKSNGYQSLHTTVFGLGRSGNTFHPVEIQIRTDQMDRDAEKGTAAHWSYKEGVNLKNKQWIQSLVSLSNELQSSSDEFMKNVTADVLNSRIFVITPKGDVKDLPENSTPIDFAYSIHSDVGDHIASAKVNGKIVPLDTPLNNGDIVDIRTDKKRTPNLAWVNIVKTNHAKVAIKQWLKDQSREDIIRLGREELNKFLKKMEKDPLDKDYGILKNYKNKNLSLKQREDLVAQVGEGSQKASDIIKSFLQIESPRNIQKVQVSQSSSITEGAPEILVMGEKAFDTRLASCCNPHYPDKISGFITRGGYVSIHKINCAFVEKASEDRFVECHWSNEELPLDVEFSFKLKNVVGVTARILNMFAEHDINLLNIDVRTNKARNTAECKCLLELQNLDRVDWMLARLKDIHGVVDVDFIVKQ